MLKPGAGSCFRVWTAAASGTCGRTRGPGRQNTLVKVLRGDEEGLERPGDLGGVERGVARPLEQVLVHVPVVAAQDRIQLPVVEIEGIHQRHGVGPEPGQELLDVSGDLQGLGNTQQPGLEGNRRTRTISGQNQPAQTASHAAPSCYRPL